MVNDEAEELGKFRRLIDGAELRDLAPLIMVTLDECVDILRRAVGSTLAIETAAALSAELHKRHTRAAARSPMVGNA